MASPIASCYYGIYHGCLVLLGEQLNILADSQMENVPVNAQEQRCKCRGASFHITVIPRHEISDGLNISKLVDDERKCSCISIGIGSLTKDSDQCWYLVMFCAEANYLRQKLGLPPKDLHCTLGFFKDDIHGPFKGTLTIFQYHVRSQSLLALQQILQTASVNLCHSELDIIQSLWHQVSDPTNQSYEAIEDIFIYKLAYFVLTKFQSYDFTILLLEQLFKNKSIEGLYIYCLILSQYKRITNNCQIGTIDMMSDRVTTFFSQEEVWYHCLPNGKGNKINIEKLNSTYEIRRTIILKTMNSHVMNTKFDKNIRVYCFHESNSVTSISATGNVEGNTHELRESCNWNLKTSFQLLVHTLPRNFGWLIPDKVCAGAIPNHLDSYLALAAIGVTDVVCLLEECPQLLSSDREDASGLKVKVHYFHVNDRCALSISDLEAISNILDDIALSKRSPGSSNIQETGRIAYVHCHGGVGRTALALAAHHIRSQRALAIGPSGAINEFLRIQCGRTVKLTGEQEARLEEWWRLCQDLPLPTQASVSSSNTIDLANDNNVTKNRCNSADKCSERSNSTSRPAEPCVQSERTVNLPSVMVLCGLPGAGKSTFAKTVEAACANVCDGQGRAMVVRVNKDEMRGKGQVDVVALEALDRGAAVIVDNCNGSAENRRLWASRARVGGKGAKSGGVRGLQVDGKAICVHFETDVAECRYRAQHRKGHPTLCGPGAASVVDREAEKFLTPAIEEGFSDIITLRSPDDVNDFLGRLSLPAVAAIDVLEPDRDIIKFPRTCHLFDTGAATRDDKILDVQVVNKLIGSGRILYIEEKLDGANMGISITTEGKVQVQNRSHIVDSRYHIQFKPLDKWVAKHSAELWQILEPGRHILYGEWLHAVHSVAYSRLPDLFLAFDLYDRYTDSFLGREELAVLLAGTSLHMVPLISRQTVDSLEDAKALVNGPSAFNDGHREGVVMRHCEDGVVRARAKLVRGDFIAGMELGRWNHGSIRTNKLTFE